jgi:replicative superfamily II helicase
VAPSKALVQERVSDWSKRLQYLGLKVVECTGDSNSLTEASDLGDADIIATTP